MARDAISVPRSWPTFYVASSMAADRRTRQKACPQREQRYVWRRGRKILSKPVRGPTILKSMDLHRGQQVENHPMNRCFIRLCPQLWLRTARRNAPVKGRRGARQGG